MQVRGERGQEGLIGRQLRDWDVCSPFIWTHDLRTELWFQAPRCIKGIMMEGVFRGISYYL